MEHQWRYAGENSLESDIINDSTYQLIVICDNQSIKNFGTIWSVGDMRDSLFYQGYKNSIITELNGLPKTDSLLWKIVARSYEKDLLPQKPLAKLVLVKDVNLSNLK